MLVDISKKKNKSKNKLSLIPQNRQPQIQLETPKEIKKKRVCTCL